MSPNLSSTGGWGWDGADLIGDRVGHSSTVVVADHSSGPPRRYWWVTEESTRPTGEEGLRVGGPVLVDPGVRLPPRCSVESEPFLPRRGVGTTSEDPRGEVCRTGPTPRCKGPPWCRSGSPDPCTSRFSTPVVMSPHHPHPNLSFVSGS